MKINQLFVRPVPIDVIQLMLDAFGLVSLRDDNCFSKADLEKRHTVDSIVDMYDVLKIYYLPCKAKVYLKDITLDRCFTIFRHLLRLYGVKLVTVYKRFKHKRRNMYYLRKDHLQINRYTCIKKEVVIVF